MPGTAGKSGNLRINYELISANQLVYKLLKSLSQCVGGLELTTMAKLYRSCIESELGLGFDNTGGNGTPLWSLWSIWHI